MPEKTEGPDEGSRLLPSGSDLFDDLEKALHGRGFEELTAIQEAVLSSELAGRDLRISSQTGSGKTVAVGFVFAEAFEDFDDRGPDDAGSESRDKTARPRVLVVAPTRELAVQLGEELSWLYGRRHLGVAVLTGGTSVGGDLRALADKPALVVGTPGRLVDHLERGTLALDALREVVLDEADEMLDMGFRDELDAILRRTPEQRRTHLVSATFPPKVQQLAKDFQRDAVLVEGTVGAQHEDISHSVLVVPARQRTDALINLLLMHADERVLVFVRTRVAASRVAGELSGLGFSTSPLSGEMAQRERTRCLADFRARKLQCLVATDVAARGLDITGVQRVVHYDLPDNRESFTHRSGRTGRAGEKGENVVFVAPSRRRSLGELFRRLQIEPNWRTPPTPDQVRTAARRRMLRRFGAVNHDAGEDATVSQAPPEYRQLAKDLLERRAPEAVIADLLAALGAHGPTEPRDLDLPSHLSGPPKPGEPGDRRAPRGRDRRHDGDFVPFHLTWGRQTGASPKRLLAHICRRGQIDGGQVGAIQIYDRRSVVDIAADVAESFAEAVAAPDPRNPRVHIEKFVPQGERRGGPRRSSGPKRRGGPPGSRGGPRSGPRGGSRGGPRSGKKPHGKAKRPKKA